MVTPMYEMYIGLGSNLGDRNANLLNGIAMLEDISSNIIKSSIYETEPVGFLTQPKFLNAVCYIEIDLNPFELLNELKMFEKSLKRTKTFKNAPRTIDLDILLCGDMIVNTSILNIPHPRMLERLFVLIPLMEINPTLLNPTTGNLINNTLKNYEDSEIFASVKLISKICG
tara:strand:+ start:14905 stop:15417 length:513 start_codon:yes stop_codon:yes gene_type:complete